MTTDATFEEKIEQISEYFILKFFDQTGQKIEDNSEIWIQMHEDFVLLRWHNITGKYYFY